MPIIEVVKRFTLTTDDGKQMEYHPGEYDVPPEVAEHWYVLPHLKGYVEDERPVQTYAQSLLQVEQAVRMGEPVEQQAQKPAPTVADPAEPVIFAGHPQEDKPMPTPDIAFVRSPAAKK